MVNRQRIRKSATGLRRVPGRFQRLGELGEAVGDLARDVGARRAGSSDSGSVQTGRSSSRDLVRRRSASGMRNEGGSGKGM